MFTVTETAREQIRAYFEENEIRPVRVFLSNGCGGSRLLLALDDKRPSDSVFPIDNFEFIVEKDLMERARPMQIDFSERGFVIDSRLELNSGCGGCGSSQNCCG